MRLLLVRHSAVVVREDRPSMHWHLSPEGRAAAEALAAQPFWDGVARVHTSPEPKAVATAQRIAAAHALPIAIERDVREVDGRQWIGGGGYRDAVQRYLAGEAVAGWEPAAAALDRARSASDGITAAHESEDVAAVSHGLLLTLLLSDILGVAAGDRFDLWSRIGFPDVAILDLATRKLQRGFGDR